MPMVTYPLNNIEYTAEDAELFHSTRTSGVYAANSFDYSVTGADNTVVIGAGIAWIKNSDFSGKVVAQKESVALDLDLPDPNYPRIDAIVIQFDANKNASEIIIKKGTASSNPVAPSIVRTESEYELHLYHIKRNAGALTISAGNITDLRLNANYCGLMADSVTKINTDAIERQIAELIANLNEEIKKVKDESAFWLKEDVIPVNNGGTGADNAEDARENLGAAPSGYGYGGKITTKIYNADGTEADFLAKLEAVYASMSIETAMQVQFVDVSMGTNFTFTGTLYKNWSDYGWLKGTSYNGCTVQRIKREGTWSQAEWENPPMYTGDECRTVERYNNEPVYTKLVSLGAFSGAQTVPVGSGYRQLLRKSAVVKFSSKSYYEELPDSMVTDYQPSNGLHYLQVVVGDSSVSEGYLQMWYI